MDWLLGANVNWFGLLALFGVLVLLAWWGHRDTINSRCVHWDIDHHLKPCPLHHNDGSAKPPLPDA